MLYYLNMKTKHRNYSALILTGIVAIGVFLRFDRLTSIPPSLSHDETAIAYNAYSLFSTGRDEYGEFFPVLFRSFDDYKLPGMVYSTIPFAAIFGKSELTARLPSAIYGTLSILVLFFVARELIRDQKKSLSFTVFSYAAAFLFAIQPWHTNFSRQLFESNGAVFWFLLGSFFLLKSTREYRAVLCAGLSFVVSLYFYYSVRLVIPFVILLYTGFHYKKILKKWKYFLLTAVICIISFLPLGIQMLSPGGLERISIVSVANDPNFLSRKETYTKLIAENPTALNKILYNRRIALVQTALENYGKNISPKNLFETGTGTYGALFPFEAILLLLGIYALISFRTFPSLFLCVWLLSAFLPGALSTKQPNTLRTLLAAPAFALISGLGVAWIFDRIQKRVRYWQFFACAAIALVIALGREFPRFHYAYFVDNPTNNAVSFADGNKQMVKYITENKNNYNRVYVSGYYWRPYIFMLYWGATDSAMYQKEGSREQIDTIVFSAASWDTNGFKFMDPSFEFSSLPEADSSLFILSQKEYETHRQSFEKLQSIHGNVARNVFVAAILNY